MLLETFHNSKLIPLAAFLAFGGAALPQTTHFKPENQQIPPPPCLTQHGAWEAGGVSAPCSEANYAEWLSDITHYRAERRIRVGAVTPGFDGLPDFYKMPSLLWTRSEFIQPQMMVHDRYFYDPVANSYTVDRYLDDLKKRYGGIDAVLIWAVYPNMGIDARNQIDMVNSMPGGVSGVRKMVADFHRRGVRVLFPMMMWDQGTHDPGPFWPDALAEEMKAIDADGVNGDTQDGVPLVFSLAAVKAGHPLAFQPEGSPSDEAVAWNVLTWGQYKWQFLPTVDRFRWLQPEHQVNISDRWNRSKVDDLQFAFFNGEGWESWENVWGIWNGITPRDGEATRRVATMERAMWPFFASHDWQPYYPMRSYGVFSSRWPLQGQTLWTVINRNQYDSNGRQMSVPAVEGERYFDLYHGVELKPQREDNKNVLSFSMEAHGYGAILATRNPPDARVTELLKEMAAMTRQPLSSFSDEWKFLPQQMVKIPATRPVSTAPEGMVLVPEGDYVFRVQGTEIEGYNDVGVDVQFPWEDSPRRYHEHALHLSSFYMDKHPVTNADFKKFLDDSHYRPADDGNFLKDWHNGTYPEGWENKPVTWVSLEDARAYAKWAGKRLPHEWEWQYAAQGGNAGRVYPWGDKWEEANVPVPDKGRELTSPADTSAHDAAASPFGIADMVGNVWQWTDEFTDEHTRGAVLRGGSYYQPQGSVWYFPQAYRNDQHSKYLLMAPSYDRSGTVGFRCVKDAGK